MSVLDDLGFGERKFYKGGYFSGEFNQELYIKRSNDDGSGRPKFYMGAYSLINGEFVQQGYLYFYLDKDLKTSDFIGVKVTEEYRNLNIGSFLVASWINLCLNNGYDFLGANEKQRKPFLLYLLKTYGFEVIDKSMYLTRKDVISVCRGREIYQGKLLLFRDSKHEKDFLGSNAFKDDNYVIIHDLKGVAVLDDIIMPLQGRKNDSVKYNMLDMLAGEEKTKRVLLNHKR